MSYILEALKKSEREREKGKIPDLKTVHNHDRSVESDGGAFPRLRYFAAIAGFVVVSLLLYVAYLEFGSDGSSTAGSGVVSDFAPERDVSEKAASHNPSTQITSVQQASVAANKGSQNSIASLNADTAAADHPVNASTSAKISQPRPNSTAATQVKSTTSEKKGGVVIYEKNYLNAKSAGKVVPISDLPDEILRTLPSLTFSGHVYSSVVAKRSIVINGKKMREGDSVNADLILRAVTPSGAVFSYKGVQFKLSALQDWSYK